MIRKIKNIYHLFQAIVASIIYGFPSRKIYVIGVTGTDGKTTTTSLIYHILKESGEKAAMISTVGAYIGDKTYDVGFHVTTPSSFELQKYIKKAVNGGNKYLVLETTSHALHQNRVFGINFQIAIITNITHEHLDYHKTYENYVKTKAKLLQMTKNTVVLNKDDESYKLISNFQFPILKKSITYGLGDNVDINPKKFPFKTNLFGKFNIYNCLAAIAVCKQLNLPDEKIKGALLTFKIPVGRQEIVYDKDFKVMIDFAHTPNSFYRILPEVVKVKKNKLIHVFGAAGERDNTKRPLMGKASAKYSDVIVLTAEDPRSESVEKIINDIEAGIENYELRIKNGSLFEVPDRREAINFAISLAQKGDFVILTGKSHEKSMNYGNGEESWDEFKVASGAVVNKLKQ